ncbi:hypothetical protein O6H91_18G030000 [Diphasiastrum complanatum]|uniref:Uncharacterized protein n=1 Tax=Diphasiastrum complanatum TaxID=34168 RepID=A0ACC2AZB5_DIPCM|nr:hypothetical protein O6H91_18G030000 [Diphasiastrum complanatum]
MIQKAGSACKHLKFLYTGLDPPPANSLQFICLKFSFFKTVTTDTLSNLSQNLCPPQVVPGRKKKPYVGTREGSLRKRRNISQRQILSAAENEVLVQSLIPVAHQVMKAREIFVSGVSELMKVIQVKACRCCSEIHVGRIGHHIKTCEGPNNGPRNGCHDWVDAEVDKVVVPVKSYHIKDRSARPVEHDKRFYYKRIPSTVELCIQAGVNIPEHLTLRRRPIGAILADVQELREVSKEIIQNNDLEMNEASGMTDVGSKFREYEKGSPAAESSLCIYTRVTAERTLEAWTILRIGVRKLMRKYSVKVCGYCPEVHVGPVGHKVRLCKAYKHQMRGGHHGWQQAGLHDIIPHQYVWHVPDVNGPPLTHELRKYYGQVPAVVELCVQAGARVPDLWRPYMRLDVAIPDLEECNVVV